MSSQGDYGASAEVLAQHGVSASPQYYDLYRSVAGAILQASSSERSHEAEQVGAG
jgi:intraflagellar transport protein 172